jgi:hypothetical protein
MEKYLDFKKEKVYNRPTSPLQGDSDTSLLYNISFEKATFLER